MKTTMMGYILCTLGCATGYVVEPDEAVVGEGTDEQLTPLGEDLVADGNESNPTADAGDAEPSDPNGDDEAFGCDSSFESACPPSRHLVCERGRVIKVSDILAPEDLQMCFDGGGRPLGASDAPEHVVSISVQETMAVGVAFSEESADPTTDAPADVRMLSVHPFSRSRCMPGGALDQDADWIEWGAQPTVEYLVAVEGLTAADPSLHLSIVCGQ